MYRLIAIRCMMSEKKRECEEAQKKEYMMLSRLEMDCKFYLGCGMRDAGYALYWEDERRQIEEMLRIYGRIVVKPEWLSVRGILRYAKQMGVRVKFGWARVVKDRIERLF